MTVLVTRAAEDAASFGSMLENLGVSWESVPLIETCSTHLDNSTLKLLFADSISHKVLVFSSPRGVAYFSEMLHAEKSTVEKPLVVIAQGPATAAAVEKESWFIKTPSALLSVSPARTSMEMAMWILKNFSDRQHFILPGPIDRSKGLEEALKTEGKIVNRLDLYETTTKILSAEVKSYLIKYCSEGVVTFFSPSAVHSWVKNKLPVPRIAASFGPVTSKALEQHSIPVTFEGQSSDSLGFAKEICIQLSFL
jgi:uroporphyrinogen-III synthase